MTFRSVSRFTFVTLLGALNAAAAPVDFTTGISTGVLYEPFHPGTSSSDGLGITLPFPDYVANKTYSAQIVGTGSDERSEAFAAIAGNKNLGFGSAVSDGKGAVEVGVFNNMRDRSYWVALSRYYTTIKNNTENEIEFDFFYVIEPGELVINGIRSDFTAHARLSATIDYLLLTPDGGTYEETTGNLFEYFVDIDFDSTLTHSANASPFLVARNDFELAYVTDKRTGSVSLPIVPAYGELTIYYDMFSSLNVVRPEVGGFARLGDPTDLVGGEGIRLVPRTSNSVPEPSAALLLGAGLAAIGVRSRRRRGASC